MKGGNIVLNIALIVFTFFVFVLFKVTKLETIRICAAGSTSGHMHALDTHQQCCLLQSSLHLPLSSCLPASYIANPKPGIGWKVWGLAQIESACVEGSKKN